MGKELIKTNKAPAAIGPYSQAVKMDNMLFVSGQLPINLESGDVVEGIENQVEQSIKNIEAICNEVGKDLDAVVKTTIFIKNMDDFGRINKVYEKFFGESVPARACVEVARLPKDVLVEIEAIAFMK